MGKKFIIETSARHIHVTESDFKAMFGENASLTKKKDLSQPGQFACEERVTVTTPKSSMVFTILGPFRNATQAELSLTDARSLGISVPVRESGDVAGSTGAKLSGPVGSVEITEGLIAAKRHIHCTPEEATQIGVENGEIVNVKVETDGRSLIFGDVIARVNPTYALAMHIDTDESNAAGISGEVYGTIVKI